ncbi:MAG: NAD(P)/FAD-dependent oxidoreductase [Bacteroidota bacterium]
MVIGIIGAGIAGLTAGRHLAKQGHSVTVIEKSRGFGGRMATRYAGKNGETKLDHGLSYFNPTSPEFQQFTAELMDKGLVQRWGDSIALYDGTEFYEKNPNNTAEARFTATDGMNSIGKYLSRWVDIKTETLAGGLTYIGAHRSKKRSWMINLSAGNTFEADAVIIATPAPQAYGILQTATDEVSALKIIREIDEVHYTPCYSLLAGYGGQDIPVWDGVECKDGALDFISNEASKKSHGQECSLVVKATPGFTRHLRGKDNEIIKRELLDKLASAVGGWASVPDWSQIHYWKYSRAVKVLDHPYMELEYQDSPLALIGDYFKGNRVDDAYCSGLKLAKTWAEKYQD